MTRIDALKTIIEDHWPRGDDGKQRELEVIRARFAGPGGPTAEALAEEHGVPVEAVLAAVKLPAVRPCYCAETSSRNCPRHGGDR